MKLPSYSPDSGSWQQLPAVCQEFFTKLKRNNNRAWFQRHKDEFEIRILEPARELVFIMGDQLAALRPGLTFDPRVNQSIFRIYRDTRFSSDKTPYKTHLGIFFWEGASAKMESSGFYLEFGPGSWMAATGIYGFSPQALDTYRRRITDPVPRARLLEILDALRLKGYTIGGVGYKRLPRGFEAATPESAPLLLHSGFWAEISGANLAELAERDWFTEMLTHFTQMTDLQGWLVDQIIKPGSTR